MIRVFLAAARFQAATLRTSWADLTALVTVPLFTLALVSILTHAGRSDLVAYAVIGSTVVAVWSMALNVSGDVIDSERNNGTFEAMIATPATLFVVVLGRTTVVTLVSLISLLESLAVARFVFGVELAVPHKALMLTTGVVTVAAVIGTASAMSGIFVLARSARTFQNSLSYPILLLGGAVVPASLLPAWLQPISKIVFLSWATDLFRDCLQQAPVEEPILRLAAIAALGGVGFAVGFWTLTAIVGRVRADGRIGLA